MFQILFCAILLEPVGSYVQRNEYKCPFIKYEKNKYAMLYRPIVRKVLEETVFIISIPSLNPTHELRSVLRKCCLRKIVFIFGNFLETISRWDTVLPRW